MATTKDTTKRRNAARTRNDLLRAARDLFGTKGYAGTTLRQIGERASVDPALVARYFGSKTAIYIASLEADGASGEPATAGPGLAPEFVDRMIERITTLGASPLLQAVVLPTSDDDVRDATRRRVNEQYISPVLQELATTGLDHPRLRAEIAFAALTGIVLARSAGMFETLADAAHADVVELTLRTIRTVLEA
ncbi:MAG: TetR family transcriptional regulator [Actinomycetota bacterium]